MKGEKLSPRQLAVAVMTSGLSAGAAAAGRADWRWMLASVPIGMLVGWALLRRVGRRPLHPALNVLYGVWAAVLMADVLRRAAGRVQAASGGRESAGWLLALLALPLIWLAALVTVGTILLLGLPRVEWRWAMEPAGSWWESMLAGVNVLSAGLFVLPHLYKVEEEPGGTRRGLVWLGALGLVSSALAALTAGLLSPAVAAQLDAPFFAAAGLLGDSARLEGLVSALWLLPDLTLAGLLAHTWGKRRRPALAAAVALGLALTGITERLPGITAPVGCLILVVLTAALPPGGEK